MSASDIVFSSRYRIFSFRYRIFRSRYRIFSSRYCIFPSRYRIFSSDNVSPPPPRYRHIVQSMCCILSSECCIIAHDIVLFCSDDVFSRNIYISYPLLQMRILLSTYRKIYHIVQMPYSRLDMVFYLLRYRIFSSKMPYSLAKIPYFLYTIGDYSVILLVLLVDPATYFYELIMNYS